MENICFGDSRVIYKKNGLHEQFAVINNGVVKICIDFAKGFKNDQVINILKPCHSFFLGLALGIMHGDTYHHEVLLDADLPGITEYQIDCDDNIIFIDTNYSYRKMSLIELCKAKSGLNDLHAGAAFQIGLFLGYKQEPNMIKTVSDMLNIKTEKDIFYLEYRKIENVTSL